MSKVINASIYASERIRSDAAYALVIMLGVTIMASAAYLYVYLNTRALKKACRVIFSRVRRYFLLKRKKGL
jgi:hypothetical protein